MHGMRSHTSDEIATRRAKDNKLIKQNLCNKKRFCVRMLNNEKVVILSVY